MDIGITNHALERMIERGVREADIKEAFLADHQDSPDDIPGRRKLKAVLEQGELVVIYTLEGARRVIISAWWK